jgi:hypothetical protein
MQMHELDATVGNHEIEQSVRKAVLAGEREERADDRPFMPMR